MPAAAVIPAPVAYINVVAVKKLVVEYLDSTFGPGPCVLRTVLVGSILVVNGSGIKLLGSGAASFTVNKIECLKQALRLEYFSME